MPELVRLYSFMVQWFKSYKTAHLELQPLTMLIGANASGKSNLIEALRLLALLARGQRLDQVFRAVEGGDVAVRGRVHDLIYENQEYFQFNVFAFLPDQEVVGFMVQLQVKDAELRVRSEALLKDDTNVPYYKVEAAAAGLSHDISVAYNNFARGGHKPRILCTDQQLVLTQLGTPARFGSTHNKAQQRIPAITTGLCAALAKVVFLDPSPRRMRGYAHVLDNRLKDDGTNLSAVIYDICKSNDGKAVLLEFIRELPEQDIADIGFVKTPRDEVMVELRA